MNRSIILAIIIALTLVGLADSAYLSQSALTSSDLVCDIDGLDDCNTVAASPYSSFVGIPLAVYGLAFYVAILIIAGYLYYRPSRLAAKLLVAATVLGAIASVYFLYLQVAVIKALCIYCLASAVISFVLCGLSVVFFKRLVPQPPAVIP